MGEWMDGWMKGWGKRWIWIDGSVRLGVIISFGVNPRRTCKLGTVYSTMKPWTDAFGFR